MHIVPVTNICARQKDDLHSVKSFFVPAQKFLGPVKGQGNSGSERDQHFADVIYGLQIAKSGDASSSNTWVNGSKHPLKYF